MMLFKLVDKGIGLVSTLILARLLAPSDFGLVAMAMAVVAFTQLMSAFGFDSALIQRKDATSQHFNTAWTFNVIFGVLIAASLVCLAWPMAAFYRDPRLTSVILVLAISALVGGFENIGVVAFRKELDFRNEFKFLLSKRIVGFVVTITCAFAFRNHWALVIGVVISRVLAVGISYRLHPYRPKLTLAARGELMHFSRWIFLSNFIGFVGGRCTDFILGRTVGAYGLGVYAISYEIATMPSTELIAPVNRAVYPAYAKLAGEGGNHLQLRFLQVFGIICFLAIPMSAGLFAAADPFVRVILGSQWLEAIVIIKIFAICGLVGALQSNMYLVLVALGKPKANTVLTAILALITMPVVVWSSLNFGVTGASYAMLLQALVAMAGIWINFLVHTKYPGRQIAKLMFRPLLASVSMAAAMTVMDKALIDASSSPGARLAVLVTSGAVIYLTLVFAAWRAAGKPTSAEFHVVEFVRERVAKLLLSRAGT